MNAHATRLWCAFLVPAMIVTVATRVFPAWDSVVIDNDVRLLGVDPYYHLRHIQNTSSTFPVLDRTDAVTNYPWVHRSDAVGLLQWTLGGVARLVGTPDDLMTSKWVCAWSGPASAVLIALVFALVSLRLWGWRISSLLTWIFVLLPGRAFDRTLFGFCDHHALEVFFNLSICFTFILIAQRRERSRWRSLPSLIHGLPMALFAFTWSGAPLFVVLTLLGTALGLLWSVAAGKEIGAFLLGLAQMLFASSLWILLIRMIAPFLIISPGYLTELQKAIALTAIASWAGSRALPPLQARYSGITLAGLLTAFGATAWLLLPVIYPGALGALAQGFAAKSPTVQEQQPVTWSLLWYFVGPAILFGSCGILWAVRRSRSLTLSERMALPILLGFVLIWIRTGDYGYNVTPAMILLTGFFWHPFVNWLRCKEVQKVATRPAWMQRAVPALPFVLATLPVLATIYPMGSVSGVVRPRAFYRHFSVQTDAWRQAMDWLQIQDQREGGVWCHWPYGNLVNIIGGWPSIQSRYPQGPLLRPMFTPGEERALASDVNGAPFTKAVRFVIADAALASRDLIAEIGHLNLDPSKIFEGVQMPTNDGRVELLPRFNDFYTQTLLGRMYTLNGDGLKHFREVFESEDQSYLRYFKRPNGALGVLSDPAPSSGPELDEMVERVRVSPPPWNEGDTRVYGALLMPTVKIFEQVKGARVVLVDSRLLEASVTLELEAFPSGRRFAYTQEGERTSADSLEFRLPYSHDAGPMVMVIPTGPYLLEASLIGGGKLETKFTVPEEAIIAGRHVHLSITLDAR